MKRKSINKKLVFNKKTIANLGNQELNQVHGGISGDYCVDNSIYSYCPSQCVCPYTVTKCYTECGITPAACK